jgi:hypothetical protein
MRSISPSSSLVHSPRDGNLVTARLPLIAGTGSARLFRMRGKNLCANGGFDHVSADLEFIWNMIGHRGFWD